MKVTWLGDDERFVARLQLAAYLESRVYDDIGRNMLRARARTLLLVIVVQLAASTGCSLHCRQPTTIRPITDEWKLLRPGVYRITFDVATWNRGQQVVSGLLHLRRMTKALAKRYFHPGTNFGVLFYGAIEIDHKKLGLRLCPTDRDPCKHWPAPTACDVARAGVLIWFISRHGTLSLGIGGSVHDLVRGGVLGGWGERMIITDVYEGGFRGLRYKTSGIPIRDGADHFCAELTELDKGERNLCR